MGGALHHGVRPLTLLIGQPQWLAQKAKYQMKGEQWIGMPARLVAGSSGHSTRVGATQDLAALDIDLAAITQAAGWRSTRMPLQYAEDQRSEVANGKGGKEKRKGLTDAQFNPAVSFIEALEGKLAWSDAIAYGQTRECRDLASDVRRL